MKKLLLLMLLLHMSFLTWGEQEANLGQLTLGIREGMRNSRITGLAQDKLGRIWMSSEGGLHVWDGYRFVVFTTSNSGLTSNDLNTVCYDNRSNSIWVGTKDAGLCIYKLDSLTWHVRNEGNGLLANCVTDIQQASDGGIWVAYYLNGADHLNAQGKVEHYPGMPPGQDKEGCWKVMDDGKGHVALGTVNHGLTLYNICTHACRNYSYRQLGVESDHNGPVLALTRDKKGHLLVGTERGVVRFDAERGSAISLTATTSPVHSIVVTQQGKTIYAEAGRGVFTIMQDRAGNIWQTNGRSGVMVELHERLPFHRTARLEGGPFRSTNEWSFDGVNLVQQLSSNGGDVTWIATTHGLFRKVLGQQPEEMKKINQQLSVHNINSMATDRKGRLWLGTFGAGLYVFTPQGRLVYNQSDNLFKFTNMVMADSQGRIWLTTRTGAAVFDASATPRLIRQFDGHNGLEDYPVYSIVEDKRGDIWLGTACSIVRIHSIGSAQRHSEGWKLTRYDAAEGVPYGQFIKGHVAVLDDGHICMGQESSSCTFYPDSVTSSRHLNTCFVSQMALVCEDSLAGEAHPVALTSGAPLSFPHDQNSFTIYLGTSDVAQADNIIFRYRIRGLSNQWFIVDSSHSFTLHGIPPGSYTIQVEASIRNSDQWSALPLIALEICQPWWWTWWMRLLYLLMLLAIAAYEWNQSRRRIRLERQLDERLTLKYANAEQVPTSNDHPQNPPGDSEGSPAGFNKLDQEFLSQLDNIIAQHIGEEELDIKLITDVMCMSHSSVYRRLKSLTGMTISEYVRKHRLKKATQLLRDGYNTNEVSMQCGFSTPNYFRRCFKAEYGCTTSEYLSRKMV